MRGAFALSVLFHLGLAALVWVGLRDVGQPLPTEQAVFVELVDASALPGPTDQPPASELAEAAPIPERQAAGRNPTPEPVERPKPPEPRPAPPAAPPPSTPPEAEPPPAEPPPPPAAPEPEPAPAPPEPAPPPPPPPEPEPQPEPAPVEQAAIAEPLPEPVPPPPPEQRPPPSPAATPRPPPANAPRPQPRPKRPEPAKLAAATKPAQPDETAKPREPEDEFQALLKSVENIDKRVNAPVKRSGQGRDAQLGGQDAPVEEAQNRGISGAALAGSIQRQVYPHWNVPIGAAGAGDIQVELRIIIAADGSVTSVEPADRARMEVDPVYRTIVESAVRAVRAASPLQLPRESYDLWRDLILVFDPSRAMAG